VLGLFSGTSFTNKHNKALEVGRAKNRAPLKRSLRGQDVYLMEIVIGIVGLMLSIGLYCAGKHHGEKLERERQLHERSLQADQRLHELSSKAADDYLQMARSHFDEGPHALASLALELLGSDELIREAIKEMHLRSGRNPWGDQSGKVDDIDLVSFFTYVRQNKIDFFQTSIENVAKAVRENGGLRKKPSA
jgi:hypothetical protein